MLSALIFSALLASAKPTTVVTRFAHPVQEQKAWVLVDKTVKDLSDPSVGVKSTEKQLTGQNYSIKFSAAPQILEIGKTYEFSATATASAKLVGAIEFFGWEFQGGDGIGYAPGTQLYNIKSNDSQKVRAGQAATHTFSVTMLNPPGGDHPENRQITFVESLGGQGLCFYYYKWGAAAPQQSTLEALDGHAFDPGTPVSVTFPVVEEPGSATVKKLGYAMGGPTLRGVVADGVSLILLRATVSKPMKANFSVLLSGGQLYPLVSDPFRTQGSASIDVESRKLDSEHYVAFALYRPPDSMTSDAPKSDIQFKVAFSDPSTNTPGPEAEKTISLLRPPVVLVHGTYDNPKECWQTSNLDDTKLGTPVEPLEGLPPEPAALGEVSMEERLKREGMRPFCVDWSGTNGSKNPSDFVTNERAVWLNPNGIKQAIQTWRGNGTAITQVDVVCHSQGGVIARVYARGYTLSTPLSGSHPHFNDPVKCASMGCWYHRGDNYDRGDIHRLVTISSTHRGSDVCRLFNAYREYEKAHTATVGALIEGDWLNLFCVYVDNMESGISTGGFRDQTPASPALQKIGPTPVPSHALACVATDEDVEKGYKGSYYTRLWKIWKATPADAMVWSLDNLRPPNKLNDANTLEMILQTKNDIHEIISHLRASVFDHDENDVTVAMKSSFGGLSEPYRTRMPHVLHGWAPRYKSIQERVVELLKGDGHEFDKNGFPDSYTGARANVAAFLVADNGAPPVHSTPAALNPGTLASGSPTAPGDLPPLTPNAFQGTWDLPGGPLQLAVNGSTATGTYKNGGANLQGTIDSDTLRFSYVDTTFSDGIHQGTGVINLATNRRSLHMHFVGRKGGDLVASRPTLLTFGGAWETPAGGMDFRVSGGNVRCSYKGGKAHLIGKVVDGVLRFTFDDSSFSDGPHHGTGTVTLNPDGKSLMMRFQDETSHLTRGVLLQRPAK